MKKGAFEALRKSPLYKGFFLLVPYVLSVFAIACAVILFFESVIAPSEYYRAITGFVSDNTVSEEVTVEEGHLPAIPYESRFATLNVDGWKERDIPVYFGDSNALLRSGAGMWLNSRFFGEPGKTVLSAHVTRHFREIEDTAIGTLVHVTADYGDYVYKVVDIRLFHQSDASVIVPDGEPEDRLIMYTCYPFHNNYKRRVQRIALICKRVSGEEWDVYG